MAKSTLNVCLDPIELEVEDLEDVLITDPLFVDYLNQYLALPIFPEKIQFNSKSAAFEIDDNASRVLTEKLRALIRSQRKTPPIYKPTREHSFRDIPLINVEGEETPEPEEIDTTLHVKVLNKEQGVGWIKKERFNMFLKSDCYLHYRLAKIIAQARLRDDDGNDVTMVTLPSRPPSRRIPKHADVIHADNREKDERIMERCFVSMGNTSASMTESWVQSSIQAHQTTTTRSRHGPVLSTKLTPSHQISARPQSSISIMDKSRYSVDSGISSPTKSLSSSSYYSSERSDPSRPITPRPSEPVCVFDTNMVNRSAVHLAIPGTKDTTKTAEPQEPSQEKNEEAPEKVEEEKVLRCDDTDQLASVITGTVLKYSIAEVTGRQLDEVAESSVVKEILPDESYKELSMADLGRISVEPAAEPKVFVPTNEADKSDEDSLMDSDGEFEDERDEIFKKKKVLPPVGSLGRLKPVEEFRKFLDGTAGQVLWDLWVDIDRLCVEGSEEDMQSGMSAIRERYTSYQTSLTTSSSVVQLLKDWDSRQWTVPQLQKLQRDLAKRLLLYWTPRYLMAAHKLPRRQLYNIKNQWNVVITGRRSPTDPFPDPKVKAAIPLRPRTCLPRRNGERIDVMKRPVTLSHPRPGYKRVHAPTSLQYAYGQVPNIEDLLAKAEKKKEEEDDGRSSRRSRATSARSRTEEVRPPSVISIESEFLGGRRLERLLQALARESLSGSFFTRFAQKSEKALWQNSIKFWKDLQKYHELFYSDTFDRFRIDRMAKHIYAMYVVEGARYSIECTCRIRRQIHNEINPPFEELFDAAEEHALLALHEAWNQMMKEDAVGFGKVEQVEVSRNFHTKNKELLAIQAKGLFKQAKKDEDAESDEDSMADYQDPVYDPSLIFKVKEEFREMSLDKLVLNRIELEYFRQFLADNYASMDLLCWMDIEAFRRIPHSDEAGRDAKAKAIRTKYLNKKYFFGPNSPAGRDSQNKVMEIGGGWGKLLDDRPPTQVLLETQKFVRERLERKWLPLFLMTPEFEERQNPAVKMDEVVDDVMVQKRKQSAAVTRMLESKWVSSSKDIIAFRKALLNPVTSAQFRRYVSLKGEFLENDVLFWREVQMFKNMYHLHNEESAIQTKITNIVQCFIDSSIPPSLQIDIRNEQADKIIDKRREMGPYVFRDAQLTVFRVLVPFWNDFCEYRKGISDASLAMKLEKQKRRQKAKMKRALPTETESKKSTARSGSSAGGSTGRLGEEVADAEEAQPEETDQKNKVQWTYSQYLDCLDREEQLNSSEFTSTISTLA